MDLYQKKEECCGCNACMDICPEAAISMVKDREGFYYPKRNKSACTGCGKCKEVCPLKNEKLTKSKAFYLGVQAKEERIRSSSSSGGIFSMLAQYVFRRKGIVYGAGYDNDMNVVHKGIENECESEQIKRTKYVQSRLEGVYRDIERNLRKNRWVLFCGTPCQAHALLLFLGRSYEKLIVVDLVCYGVPSPGIWERYVKYLEHKHQGKMTDFSFRDKRNKDNGHARSYKIDGREYVDSIYQDMFCRMYFRNYTLRPACYSCTFCKLDKNTDFTIGDFWGIERIMPAFDDGMGTSLVIGHSERAGEIWNEIKDEVKWFECKREDLMQPRLVEPVRLTKARQRFMLVYKMLPFQIIMRIMEK